LIGIQGEYFHNQNVQLKIYVAVKDNILILNQC